MLMHSYAIRIVFQFSKTISTHSHTHTYTHGSARGDRLFYDNFQVHVKLWINLPPPNLDFYGSNSSSKNEPFTSLHNHSGVQTKTINYRIESMRNTNIEKGKQTVNNNCIIISMRYEMCMAVQKRCANTAEIFIDFSPVLSISIAPFHRHNCI